MSSCLLLAFFSAAVLVEADVLLDAPETRIVGGHEIEIEDAPWQVSLQNDSRHICGGSIISTRWILTAAHCTEDLDKTIVTVLIGTKSLEEGGTRYEVSEMVEHENYSAAPDYDDDICVLKTTTEMKLTLPVKAVTLPDSDAKRPPIDTKLKVSGWGVLDDGSPTTLLRAVDVVVRHPKDCRSEGDPTEICTGPKGKGFCSKDSGGPLVQGDLLVGVVNSIRGEHGICIFGSHAYKYVGAYRDWIKTKTRV